mmetsp:Transcript_18936/g.39709  ORF Transcript_18936/g.39709 Transcript_18936/m.39709 type:complete len:91 (+) Transcript_18936:301-573(+)
MAGLLDSLQLWKMKEICENVFDRVETTTLKVGATAFAFLKLDTSTKATQSKSEQDSTKTICCFFMRKRSHKTRKKNPKLPSKKICRQSIW